MGFSVSERTVRRRLHELGIQRFANVSVADVADDIRRYRRLYGDKNGRTYLDGALRGHILTSEDGPGPRVSTTVLREATSTAGPAREPRRHIYRSPYVVSGANAVWALGACIVIVCESFLHAT